MADNAVTGAKVADRSLSAADITLANGSPTVDLPTIPANDCAYVLRATGTEPGRRDRVGQRRRERPSSPAAA